jgi:cation transport regulator ChaC
VRALTFVANRDSDAYQRLSEHEILTRLSGCCGQRGANRDYAVNTHLSLQERGVHDARLARRSRRFSISTNTEKPIAK